MRNFGRLSAMCAVSLLASSLCIAQQSDISVVFDGNAAPGVIAVASGSEPPIYVEGRPLMFGNAASLTATLGGTSRQALRFVDPAAVAIPLEIDLRETPQITITAWIRRAETSRIGWLVNMGSNQGLPALRIYGNKLRGRGGSVSWVLEGDHDVIPADEWTFVAGVWDFEASTMRLHMNDLSEEISDDDGRLSLARVTAQKPVVGPDGVEGTFLTIGALDPEGFRGAIRNTEIDDVAVYFRALSPGEIFNLRRDMREIDGGNTELGVPDELDRTNKGVIPLSGPGLGDGLGGRGSSLQVPAGVGTDNSGVRDPDLVPMDTTLQDQVHELTQPREPLPAAPMYEETYSNTRGGPIKTVDIVVPGGMAIQTITYQEIDGLAVTEGDIILGPVDDLERWTQSVQPESTGVPGVRRQGLNAIANTDFLWPQGRIPYEVASGLPISDQNNIAAAVSTINSMTNLTFFARGESSNQTDYVEFVQGTDSRACSASVGRQRKRQKINVSTGGCRVETFIHEMLHAAGVWHEQSRPDRDTFVEVLIDNVQTSPDDRTHNFEKKSLDDGIGVGNYNFNSIMHYRQFDFGVACTPSPPPGSSNDPNCGACGRNNGVTTCAARTIRPRSSSDTISRDNTLASDVADINALYPSIVGPQLGLDWGNGNYGTATAVGDIDGDGHSEIVVGRFANDNARVFVYDDALASHTVLGTAGTTWGAGAEVTDIALGDVDGDGVMEIGVTRRAGANSRWFIYRFKNSRLTELASGGDDWGSAFYATSIAFGDIDGDGKDEFAVGRRAGTGDRYFLFNDGAAANPFERLAIGGSQWGSSRFATALAFGDVDGDGLDELGITRNAGTGMRFEIVSYTGGQLQQIYSGGDDWGDSFGGTAIAFGSVDNDDSEEFVVGRQATNNSRFFVHDDRGHNFNEIETGGDIWGSNYYVTGVALADVDNDSRDEVIVARNAGENGRYFVFNDRLRGFTPIPVGGAPLFSGVGATDIAAGDMDGDGKADLAITYDEKTNTRMRWEAIYLNPPRN